jgi:hypothetical protein
LEQRPEEEVFEEEVRPLLEALAHAAHAPYAAFTARALRRALLACPRLDLPLAPRARAEADGVVAQGLSALLRWARDGFGGDDGAAGAALEAAEAAANRLPEGHLRLRRAVGRDPSMVQVKANAKWRMANVE